MRARRPRTILLAVVTLAGLVGAGVAIAIAAGPSATRGTTTRVPPPRDPPSLDIPARRSPPQVVEPIAGGATIASAPTTSARARPTAGPRESEPRAGVPIGPGGVYVQGDSLMVGTDPYLKPMLAGWTFGESVKSGRSLPEGLALLRPLADSLPPVLVVGLGSNDDAGYPTSFADGVDELLRLAGPLRCVIWVDIWRPFPGDRFQRFNAILDNARTTHPNLIVIPWSSIAAAHPEWFGLDVVHPAEAGYAARAQLVAAAVRQCQGG